MFEDLELTNSKTEKIGCNATAFGVHPYSALDLFLENVMLHVYISAKSIVMQLSTV